LDVAGLVELLDKPVLFEQRLLVLQKSAPRDSHLKVLEGDYHYASRDIPMARAAYEEATNLNPGLAEAWFRLGVLYDQQGLRSKSIEMYKRAVELSRLSPHYRSNLADQYFQRGEYEDAIAQYEQISKFPLAALESARIQLLLHRLPEATALQVRAIGALEDPGADAIPENRAPWYFKLGKDSGVRLTSLNEKLCFARLNLAATMFLRSDPVAEQRITSAASACGDESFEIKALLRDHLDRLSEEQPQLGPRVREFTEKHLRE
jgi:tetratricopeptide (TPR) repeat protein